MNYCIRDIDTHDVLVQGPIISMKDTDSVHYGMELISLDGRYFFNLNSGKFVLEETEDVKKINYVENDRYVMLLWREVTKDQSADIYREFDYEVLDEEVKELCYAINRLNGVHTHLSCCGHGKSPLWVCCVFTDMCGLENVINPLRKVNMPFYGKFRIDLTGDMTKSSMDTSGTQSGKYKTLHKQMEYDHGFELTICTVDVGEKAYGYAEELAKYYNTKADIYDTRKNTKDKSIL